MSCGVGCRLGWDPMFLWLWCRPVATAWIRPLAPYAVGAKKKKKKENSIFAQNLLENKEEKYSTIHSENLTLTQISESKSSFYTLG